MPKAVPAARRRSATVTALTPPAALEARELAEAKLAESGLTIDDAAALGISVLTAPETALLGTEFAALPALRFAYLTPDGRPVTTRERAAPYFRVRYLKAPGTAGFTSQTVAPKKPVRYQQPRESGLAAYFPLDSGWPAALADPERSLLITEGELKAAAATRAGFMTIGLGGVSSFRTAKGGLTLLPELDAITWTRRNVFIVYDSDVRTNPNVANAINVLAGELMQRGAYPFVTWLPELDATKKTGLDDLLVARGPEFLREVLDASQDLTLAKALYRLNERAVYVRDPGLVVLPDTGQVVKVRDFTDHVLANETHAEQVVTTTGAVTLQVVPAAGAWIRWPLRRAVHRLVYEPGQPAGADYAARDGTRVFNTWTGWGCVPAAGDVDPFLRLVDHLFTGAEPADQGWFLRWLAYPLQYPGTKLFTSVLLWGREHGTGKSLVGYTMKRLYGKANFSAIKQKHLESDFNEWAVGKQFVLGDDITGSDRRHDADVLKKLITQEEMNVNRKNVPEYVIDDCLNYLFTSNQPAALFLEDRDRRHFIHEVTVGAFDEEFYKEYLLWRDSTAGPAALFHWLLRLDLGDFNPEAPARRTLAKERMTQDVQSDLAAWVRLLVAAPDLVLKLGQVPLPADLFTTRQLLQLYDPEGRTRVTAAGLGLELARAGVPQALGGQPVRAAGTQARYYVLRNHARWTAPGVKPDAVRTHLEEAAAEPLARPPKF